MNVARAPFLPISPTRPRFCLVGGYAGCVCLPVVTIRTLLYCTVSSIVARPFALLYHDLFVASTFA